jgi:predicted negative regulator of RcsB-dependent stress response
MKRKMDKKSLAIICLVILVVGLFAYLGIQKIRTNKAESESLVYQEGVTYGYQYAIYSLIEQASTCETVPVTYENYTLNVIAVECFQGNTTE